MKRHLKKLSKAAARSKNAVAVFHNTHGSLKAQNEEIDKTILALHDDIEVLRNRMSDLRALLGDAEWTKKSNEETMRKISDLIGM